MTELIVLLLIFVALVIIGTPMGVSLGITGVACVFIFNLGYDSIGVNVIAGIAKFPLLAIPFFILAGVIFEKAGLAAYLAEFFELLLGRAVGGLGIVAVVTCMFWGALSGSGPATTAAVGLILIGPMVKNGYDKNFAAATIANASDLSIIIPPSIAFIIFGSLTGAAVDKLFVAGVVPGILMGLGIILVTWLISWKRGYRGISKRGSMKEIGRAFLKTFWIIMVPVIILGGIYRGYFTPTEAAVIAVFYSLFISMVVYRTVKLHDLMNILVEATVLTAVIMFIVTFAGIFSYAAETLGILDRIAHWFIAVSPNAFVMILMMNLLLLVLGMFLDAISISYLIMPILLPVINKFNIDPIWYGVVFITALAIGQTTPPVGVNLYTAANLIKGDVDAISKEIIPYVVINVIILVLLSTFSCLSLWLPTTFCNYLP